MRTREILFLLSASKNIATAYFVYKLWQSYLIPTRTSVTIFDNSMEVFQAKRAFDCTYMLSFSLGEKSWGSTFVNIPPVSVTAFIPYFPRPWNFDRVRKNSRILHRSEETSKIDYQHVFQIARSWQRGFRNITIESK